MNIYSLPETEAEQKGSLECVWWCKLLCFIKSYILSRTLDFWSADSVAEIFQRYTRWNIFKILLNQTDNQIVFTIFLDLFGKRQTDTKSIEENSKYNLISVWFIKISKIFLCVYV